MKSVAKKRLATNGKKTRTTASTRSPKPPPAVPATQLDPQPTSQGQAVNLTELQSQNEQQPQLLQPTTPQPAVEEVQLGRLVRQSLNKRIIEARSRTLERLRQPDDPTSNQNSRRLSTVSQISHFSGGDFSNSANGGLADNPEADESGQPRKRFQSNDSYIQEQVPVLPVPAAVLVLTLNVLLPGFGTIMSGLLYLCVGPKEHRKVQGFFKPVCINFWVGISQLVTVTFLLVGWFWSLAWGIYAVQKALDLRDELRRKRKQEIAEKALNALMGGGVGSGDGDGGGHHAGGLINLLRPR